MAIEYKRTKAPAGFDPRNDRHVAKLLAALAEAGLGEGWRVARFEPERQLVLFARGSAMVSIEGMSGEGERRVSLAGQFGPADGGKAAEKLEAMPDLEGLRLVEYRPHRDEAVMAPLTAEEDNARSRLASVLGVKRWEVRVHARHDGGFTAQLPKDRYLPAKHDGKLQETVENGIGEFGWYVTVDKTTSVADIRPGTPPSFPGMVPYPSLAKPTESKAKAAWQMRLPVGRLLGTPAEPDGGEFALDLDGDVGALIVGLAGSGKSVTVNSIIVGLLERGWDLAIGDTYDKSGDYEWCKDFVVPNGFGVRSPLHTAAMLAELYEGEYKRRGELLRTHGVQKFQELPAAVRPAPQAILLDELQGIVARPPVLKSMSPDDPRRLEAEAENMAIDVINLYVNKLIAEGRAAGIRVLLVTQQAQEKTGVSQKTKMNLPHRFLLGPNPGEASRGHAFLDPRSAPRVPDHVAVDQAAARGTGVFEYGGSGGVFKSYFGTVETYRSRVEAAGRDRVLGVEVSDALIEKHLGVDVGEQQYGLGERIPDAWETGPDGERLTGRERANAARAEATRVARGA